MQIQPLKLGFAAEITGLDVRNGLDGATHCFIEEALRGYPVLCFRNQPIDDGHQQAFIQMFGPPFTTAATEISGKGGLHPHLYDISTTDDEARPVAADSMQAVYLKANLLWHTDGTQVQPPLRVTALSARTLPPVPPDTEYADMRAAWDAMPEDKKSVIQGLRVEHSLSASRAKIGLTKLSDETLAKRPPVVQPLVRTHASGRKSIYLSSHASHVIGMPAEESHRLLQELEVFATQRRFVYSHAWRPHDLLLWDDSCTMHRATEYKEPYPRRMRWSGALERAATV